MVRNSIIEIRTRKLKNGSSAERKSTAKSFNQQLFEAQQDEESVEMRTIITKTKRLIRESKELLIDKEKEELKQKTKFYENFIQDDMRMAEQELFPIEDIHIGELNLQIGQRIHNEKLSQLRMMR